MVSLSFFNQNAIKYLEVLAEILFYLPEGPSSVVLNDQFVLELVVENGRIGLHFWAERRFTSYLYG